MKKVIHAWKKWKKKKNEIIRIVAENLWNLQKTKSNHPDNWHLVSIYRIMYETWSKVLTFLIPFNCVFIWYVYSGWQHNETRFRIIEIDIGISTTPHYGIQGAHLEEEKKKLLEICICTKTKCLYKIYLKLSWIAFGCDWQVRLRATD